VIQEDCVFLSELDVEPSRVRNSNRLTDGAADLLATRLRYFLALCDQGVVSLTNFGTGLIIGRVCGKSELGVYMLAWTLVTLATEISAALIITPYTVFGPQLTGDHRKRYLGSMLVHQSLLSVLFASAIAIAAALGSSRGILSHSVSTILWTTAAVIVFVGLREFVRRVSFAELRIGSALCVDLCACLSQIGGMLVLLHSGALTASGTYIVIGISSATTAVGWIALRRKLFRLSTRLWLGDLTRNWSLAKWVLGSGLLWTLSMYLYPWVLAAFHGTSVTGIWAASCGTVALGNPVLLGLGNYIGPTISNLYAASGIGAMRRYVHRSGLLFVGLLLPLVLALLGFGDRIVTAIYGSAYSGNSVVIALLAVNLLLSAWTFPYSRGLFTLECAKTDMMANLAAFILLFTVGIGAVKTHAALGAALSLVLSNSVTAIIRMGAFVREVRRRT
jgi:O-antigen/teichoic acid export membrane protein